MRQIDKKALNFLVDALTEAIQMPMGIPLSHKDSPWARARQMVKDGKADAFITLPTPERRTYTDNHDAETIGIFPFVAKQYE